MPVPVVVVDPVSVVTAQEAVDAGVFTDDDDEDYVDTLLKVAQSTIDGSYGWLGRAIGRQTLEMSYSCVVPILASALPLPPWASTVSDVLAEDGRSRTVRWTAGWTPETCPAPIKHAIILMAGELRAAVPSEEGLLKRETVDGVGSQEYSLPDSAATAMRSAAERLLAPYKIWRV